jgi:hypothetical protein
MKKQYGYNVITADSFKKLTEQIKLVLDVDFVCLGAPIVWNDNSGKQKFSQAVALY